MLYTIVDISDVKISDDPDDTIVTYSLGSCLGLSLYDPKAGVGGIGHFMLPLSKIDKQKAVNNPFMFVDTGVITFLEDMFAKGAKRKNIIAKAAGCASLLDSKKLFDIGGRNFRVLKKILEKNNIKLAGVDIGGTSSRTMFLYIATGETMIRSRKEETEL